MSRLHRRDSSPFTPGQTLADLSILESYRRVPPAVPAGFPFDVAQLYRRMAEDIREGIKLTRWLLQHGIATTLDVLLARQVLDTANAQIPDLERQIGQTEDAINILLGKYPDNVPRGQPLGSETPDGRSWNESPPPQIPAGLPSELLERSPDIREAEQNLVAANANIGVAKGMFLPQISLLGCGGAAFAHSQFLGSHIPAPLGVGTYTAAASQPLFEGGALRNNLRYAKSEERQALIGNQQTIQRAFGDVSNSLIGGDKYHSVRER